MTTIGAAALAATPSASLGLWLAMVGAAYLSGSIPFGLVLGRMRGVDIREHGSRNIGATNVGRVLGKPWGVLCFVLDALKGAAPVAVAGWLFGMWGEPAAALGATALSAWLAVAIAALAGHMASPWLRFRGGKGVATGFGALLAVWPVITVPALLAFACWIVTLAALRFVSLASVVAAAALPLLTVLWSGLWVSHGEVGVSESLGAVAPAATITALVGALVIVRHRSNIRRLVAGTEPRIWRDRNHPGHDGAGDGGPASR